LHLISEDPSNGYEIFQLIGEKTVGSWRPRAGSIYLTLRKLAKDGLIRESSKSHRPSNSSQRIYEITPEGAEFLSEGKDVLANADRNWFDMRGIFIDMMDATKLPSFLTEGSKANFQLSREIIEAKLSKLNQKEAGSALTEYALNLREQLRWTEAKMRAGS
jgi:DNA-binding PadR family transcriptional regulator